MNEELKERLKKAQHDLDEAVVVVARCAQDVSDDAFLNIDDVYEVDTEDIVELRNALAHWKKCTQAFLEAVDAVGSANYERQLAIATGENVR